MTRTFCLILFGIGLTMLLAGVLSGPFYDFLSFFLYLLGGLVIAISFGATLFLKFRLVSRLLLITILVAILSSCLLYVFPLATDLSYKIFIEKNESELKVINSILQAKQGKIEITESFIIDEQNQLTLEERQNLQTSRRNLGVYLISRDEYGIFYGISGGEGDIRLGATYYPGENSPVGYRKLVANWYR